MIKKILFLSLISYLLSLICLFALDINYGEQKGHAGFPGEYLTSFSANARALGMGSAYTALADDTAGVYFNPAGLSQLTWRETSFLYSQLFLETQYSFAGYAHPFMKRNVLGVSWIRLGVDDIEKTDFDGSSEGTTFSDVNNTFMISYARKFGEQSDAGCNLKLATQNIYDHSATGYGLDLGGLYHLPSEIPFVTGNLSAGLMLQNVVSPTFKPKYNTSQKDVFPANARCGIGWEKNFGKKSLLVASDAMLVNLLPDSNLYSSGSGKTFLRWFNGAEFSYPTRLVDFVIRAGINYKELTAGAGLQTRNFIFDYACGFHQFDITHRFGLRIKFGLLPTEEEKIIAKQRVALEIETAYNESLSAFNQKDFDTAKNRAQKTLELNINHKGAQKILDEIAVNERKYRAEKAFQDAFNLIDIGKENEAGAKIQEAIELDPNVASVIENDYLEKAEKLMSQKQYIECRKTLIKVLRINPNNKKASEILKKLETVLEYITQ